WAGAEAQVATLLRALARRPDLRISAILLNQHHLADELRDAGIPLCVLPESVLGFREILHRATPWVRAGVDILHSHRYKENLLAYLLARRCRVRVLVRTQHGWPEPFTGWQRFKQGAAQTLDRWLARYATDLVITVSDDLHQRVAGFMDSARIVTVNNAIARDRVRSHLTPAAARKKLGLAVICPVVGTAGRLESVKRLDLFLAAAHSLAEQVPGVHFLVVGAGSQDPSLKRLAADLGLAERVLFLGHRQDVYDVIRAMDVFLLSSDHEGLPMAVLEALALGVPVVARSVGGVPQVVREGENGFLVNSSDSDALARACLPLLQDPLLQARLSAGAAAGIPERFQAEYQAAEVTRLYGSLLNPSQPSPAPPPGPAGDGDGQEAA
ncbi:MAG: glycosyltransferase, partial [Acidobacteria bacterium]|nr:glycosyltransferase [Acidobacteriota bacterium]